MKKLILSAAVAALISALYSAPSTAQDDEDEIVVTGSRIAVTQGGAQDIEYFKTSLENGYLPTPSAITS